MDHFDYRGGVLHAEGVPLPEIAAAVGTPVYVYSTATLTRHYRVFEEALAGLDHLICYAMKANSNLAVLRLMASLGAGMDVVSEGEYRRARAAGVPGRADRLLRRRQDPRGDARWRSQHGIRQFNVELRARARRALRGRARHGRAWRRSRSGSTPTSTRGPTPRSPPASRRTSSASRSAGRARSMPRRRALPGIAVVGIDVHIGSQLTELAPYEAAFAKVAELTAGAARRRPRRSAGSTSAAGSASPTGGQRGAAPALRLRRGGPADGRAPRLRDRDRARAADRRQRRVLLARVIYLKHGEGRDFLILDAAMNDLVRPAMYDAWHDIVPVVEPPAGVEMAPVDVVGPVCETGDTFARARAAAAARPRATSSPSARPAPTAR